MRISNGNFLDEDGNEVNLVELLRTGKATPVVNNDGHHMSAHSGWFTDENGTPVNIVALIDAAIDEDGDDDEPAIGGISVNGGNVVTPDENGIINLTISGDGSTVIDSELSASSTNPVQNKVVTGEINSLNESVTELNGSLENNVAIIFNGITFDASMFEKGSIGNSGENTSYRATCRCRLISKHEYNSDVTIAIVGTNTQVYIFKYQEDGTLISSERFNKGTYPISANTIFRIMIDGRRALSEMEMTIDELLAPVTISGSLFGVNKINEKITDIYNKIADKDNIPDYYFENDYLPEKAREAQLAAGVNGISFGFVTDIHIGDNAQNSMKLAKYIADHTSALPLMICGGDIPETNTGDLNGLYEQAQAWQVMMSHYGKHNVYTCRGNHDYIAKADNTNIKAKNALSNSYVMGYLPYGITPGMEGQPYYYFDVDWAKTRFIVLDEYSVSNTNPDADTSVYVGLSADEYNWFVNTALKVDNYHIVIVAHQPLNLPNGEGYNASLNLLRDIITAFNQHVAFTGSYGAASINVDFSTYTSELVCVLSGHMHKDVSSDTGFLNIVTTSDACYSTDGYGRQFGTVSENAFDVVSIDYNNRVIKCTRIGAGNGRQFAF